MAVGTWGLGWVLLGGGVIFAFFSLFRFAVNVGFIERPIVQGAIWGTITGQPELGLKIGFFFELLWLDLFPAGTFIPPQSIFSVFSSVLLVHLLLLSTPSEIFLVMMSTIPFAFMGAWLENRQREWQNKNYNLLLRWASKKQTHAGPKKMIGISLLQQLALNTTFGGVGLYVLYLFWNTLSPHIPQNTFLSWPVAWLLAGIGGMMALRIRRAYLLFLGMVAGAGGLLLVSWLGVLPVWG